MSTRAERLEKFNSPDGPGYAGWKPLRGCKCIECKEWNRREKISKARRKAK
jgi:hypothetical protein